MKAKKQTEKKKRNGQSRTIKFKNHSQLFSLSTNLIGRLDVDLKKTKRHRENTKHREKVQENYKN